MQSDSTLSYMVKIQNWNMSFELENQQLHISGSNQQTKKIYNAYYDNLSLPERVYKEIGATEDLIVKIMKSKNLKIQDDSLIIQDNKSKPLFLPLASNNQKLDVKFQADLSNVPFPIKKVSKNLLGTLPYMAAVYVIAFCQNQQIKDAQITSSGVLIKNKVVLTVAHAVYNRQHNLEAKRVSVFIQSNGTLKQVSVKKHYFPQQYKTVNLTDLPKYDFAILELEDNKIVTQKHLLQMKWNWVQESQLVEVVGFSKKLDLNDPLAQHHMKCKVIARFETFLTYDGKAQSGISGAPIVIFEDNKFKVIGLHQGLHINLSRGILLSSFSQNPYQILKGIIKSSQVLPIDILCSSKIFSKKQMNQMILLKRQNEQLKKLHQKKDNQFYNLQKEIQRLKSKIQNKVQDKLQNFKIIKKLGQGKFGSVFLAIQKYTGIIVALKMMEKRRVIQENFLTQFIRQLKIQTYLDHPNIAKVYGFFHDTNYFYTIMELGQGGQLYDVIMNGQAFTQESTSFIIGNLLDAINYMHTEKILHRDIRPQNIVLVHGNVKLCDFGWAVYKKEQLRSTFCETSLYLSPQLLNGQKYGQKVDLWAIGILAYQLHLGCSPFDIKTQQDLLKIITDQIHYPQTKKVSSCFKQFMQAVLKKNPNERESAQKLLNMKFIKKY